MRHLNRRQFIAATAASVIPQTGKAQTLHELLLESGWMSKLRELWKDSREKDLEHSGAFARLRDRRKYWLPMKKGMQTAWEVSAKVDWEKTPSQLADAIVSIRGVHVHPPRTLAEFLKEHLLPVTGDTKENELVADPPSLGDVASNPERTVGLPERLRGKIRFNGLVLSIGGGWSWEYDQTHRTLTPQSFNEHGRQWKKIFLEFILLSATFRGNTSLLLRDPRGKDAYDRLIAVYRPLGVIVAFHDDNALRALGE